MIYLLLGADDFTKREFVEDLRQKNNAELLDFYSDSDPKQILWQASNSGLFENKKVLRIFGLISALDQNFFEKVAASENICVFVEESLDKRKTENKRLLSDKNLMVKEFAVPEGPEFRKWAAERAKKYNLKLTAQAFELFLNRLGIGQGEFGKQLYDLWQADSELKKLKMFAGETQLKPEDIENLVSENIDENIFKITNAIADRNKTLAVKYLTDYMDRLEEVDDKGKVISLSGILAEQFRGILMIQDLVASGASDSQIQKQTGFSPGRLFIYKKLAHNFSGQKALDALRKLELLDQEIKTSNSPAALQFFMIMNSAMN